MIRLRCRSILSCFNRIARSTWSRHWRSCVVEEKKLVSKLLVHSVVVGELERRQEAAFRDEIKVHMRCHVRSI